MIDSSRDVRSDYDEYWHDVYGLQLGLIISINVNPRFEVMQFTGLLDKNDKEIYEGDIVDFAGLKPVEIVWKDNGFKSSMHGSEPIHLTQEGMSMFGEIIGNIYENPELLK